MVEGSERTFVIFKPEVTRNNWSDHLFWELSKLGLRLVAAQFRRLNRAELEQHYAEHLAKPGLRNLMLEYIDYMCSEEVWILVYEAPDAIRTLRTAIGATMPDKAAPGTIRRRLGFFAPLGSNPRFPFNIIHSSDCVETAQREIAIFFGSAKG